jgi:hypothetical protein
MTEPAGGTSGLERIRAAATSAIRHPVAKNNTVGRHRVLNRAAVSRLGR